MKLQTVGIIGGKGLMGSFFAKFFKELGFKVLVSDINTKLTNKELAKKSDIVFFSVPINLTEKVIKEVLPLTRADQLLLDCTSLKMIPMKEMMKSKAQVIGLHPMFRASSLNLKKQKIVMCIGRAKPETIKIVTSWFTNKGATVVKMTAKEHDKLMSIIQSLLHFHTIVLGHTISRLGIPIKETLKTASPIYKLEMDMIGRIFSQDPLLYGAISMFNPESKRAIATLLDETKKMAIVVSKKDLSKFKKSFVETSNFLGNFKDEAFEEINTLLTHLQ
jgi:prephenate dehydrogenase